LTSAARGLAQIGDKLCPLDGGEENK
jgi:hypothetical protein